MSKEFMPWIESIKTRYKLSKVKSILKIMWGISPISWSINILSRMIIGSTVLHYLEYQNLSSTSTGIIIGLFMIQPFFGLFNNIYYEIKYKLQQSEIDNMNANSGQS